MAVRHATLDLSDFDTFLDRVEGSLSSNALEIPAGTVDGKLAAEFKLDLLLPLVGRYGPLKAQVIQRMPDGSVAVRLPEHGKLELGIEKVWARVEAIKSYLVEKGDVVLPSESVPDEEEQAEEPAVAAAPMEEPAEEEFVEEIVEEIEGVGGVRDGYALPPGMDREPDHSGSCEDRSLRDYLVDAAASESTGILTVVAPDGTKRFGFWLNGGPVGWRSDPLRIPETVGGLLVGAGQLDEEQRKASLQVMEQQGCRQGQALIGMELLAQGQLAMLLRKQAVFLLKVALRTRKGIWSFHEIEDHVEAFAIEPVVVPDVLYRLMLDFSKNVSSEIVIDSLKARLDSRVSLVPAVESLLARFDLDDKGGRFLKLLGNDPPLRVRKIFSLTPLSKVDTAGTIWALEQMGMVSVGAETANDGRRLQRLAGPLLKKAGSIETENLFDVLEIHWICTRVEVEQAYSKLARRWSPAVFGSVSADLSEGLQIIETRLKEARERLDDDGSRRAYRHDLVGEELVSKCADFLAIKGTGFIEKEDRPMAIRCFTRATELEPDQPVLQSGLERAEAMKRVYRPRSS